MKRGKRILIWCIVLIFVLFFTVGAHFINIEYNKYVKSKPSMYCYETYFGPSNAVLFIKDLKYKEKYINYYKKVERREDPYVEFPVNSFPTDTPVYVMGYSEDMLLADVVSYYDRGRIYGGSYTRAWVYAKTLHDNPMARIYQRNDSAEIFSVPTK